MPYNIFKQDNEFCVFKVDDAGDRTGSALGCHSTRAKAGKQIAALEIAESEDKEVDMNEEKDIKEKDAPVIEEKELYADSWTGEVHDTDEMVPWGATSFEEYDASVEAKKSATEVKKNAKIMSRLIDNIVNSDMIQNPVAAIRGVAEEFASRFGGSEDKEVEGANTKTEIKPFMVYKGEDGAMRFLTSYSNNRRDMDNPPEIISAASHERFEKMVDAGEADYPDLWLWHTPSLVIGKADFIAYDKDNGVAMASGYFFKEAEFIAEAIADNPDFWGVSHGMPSETVKRSKEDPTVIIEHITKEISPLPFQAAANKWADFKVLKEVNMSLTQEKKEQLAGLGVGTDMLDAIDENNKSLNEKLDELDIESKEETSEDVVEEQENVDEQEQEKEADTETVEEEKEAVEDGLFNKEQTEQLAEVFSAVIDRIEKKIDERLAPIEERLAERKTVEEAAEEIIKQTPAMSFTEMVLNGSVLKQQSATQAEDTVIDGRTKLAQDKPAETKASRPTIVKTGSGFMDDVLTNIVTPQEQETA